jgi:hypothetical protein
MAEYPAPALGPSPGKAGLQQQPELQKVGQKAVSYKLSL